MDYFKLIQERKSIREYKNKEVPAELLDELKAHFETCPRLVPEIDVKLHIASGDAHKRLYGVAGYKGFLIEAPYYLVLLSDNVAHCEENAGFLGAELLMKLADLGLDHCWITFDDSPFVKKVLGLDTEQEVVTLVAFGYGKHEGKRVRLDIKSPSSINVTVTDGSTAPKLDVDDMIFSGVWGEPGTVQDFPERSDIRKALIAASVAPTFLNRQPYRIILDGNKVVLVKIEDEMTDRLDSNLNMGIVLQHFTSVMSERHSAGLYWSLQAPEKDYKLPEGCSIVAYCEV